MNNTVERILSSLDSTQLHGIIYRLIVNLPLSYGLRLEAWVIENGHRLRQDWNKDNSDKIINKFLALEKQIENGYVEIYNDLIKEEN
jgi:hypothetical protein